MHIKGSEEFDEHWEVNAARERILACTDRVVWLFFNTNPNSELSLTIDLHPSLLRQCAIAGRRTVLLYVCYERSQGTTTAGLYA